MKVSFSEQATSAINPSDVMVVILGGGHGARLYPLTKGRAKPAVNFGGKYRIIDIPLTNCLNSQLNKIFILTQFNSFSLNRHIWQSYSREVSRDGFIDIIAAEQTISSNDWFQGTADAVRRSLPYLLYHKPKYVLVLSGDQIYSMDYNFLFSFHNSHNADVTIAALYRAPDEISRMGIVKVNKDLKVVDFCEKPKTPDQIKEFKYVNSAAGMFDKPYLSSMGIYLFNTEALQTALEGNEPDFGKGVIPPAAKKMTMSCFPFNGYWEDVGTIKTFYDANMEWLDGGGIAELFQGGQSILTHARQLPPAKIHKTIIENSIVSEGSIIQAESIKHSIIGVRSRIGRGCTIEDSIVMGTTGINNVHDAAAEELFDEEHDDSGDSGDTKTFVLNTGNNFEIGEGCYIKNAILDKDVVIGKGSKIVNIKGVREEVHRNYVIRSGIVVIAQNTVIPPGTII